MSACVAYGCTNRHSRKGLQQLQFEQEMDIKVTFHKFPKEQSRRRLWINAVRRKNWEPSSYSVLCSSHFTEECFDRTSLCVVRLRENAVPTIFPEFPLCLQQVESTTACAVSEQLPKVEAPESDHENETLITVTHVTQCTRSTSVSPDREVNSPLTDHLKSTIIEMKRQYRVKVKTLQQKNRRLCKKVEDLNNIIEVLKEKIQ